MSIRKTLLMLTLNYILIFVWMFWFRMEEMSALIIFPITILIAFFDTILAESRRGAYLWCGNLLIATIVGIILQAYLFIRETGDQDRAILRVAVEVPIAILLIGIIAVISGHEAAKLSKKRRRRQLTAPVYHSESVDTDEEDDEPDDEEENFFSGSAFGRSDMGSSHSMALPGDDEEPDDEENDTPDEPKFRVIRK